MRGKQHDVVDTPSESRVNETRTAGVIAETDRIRATSQATATIADRATEDRDHVDRNIELQRFTGGQRRINMIWESTQALIAIGVSVSTLYAATILVLREPPREAAFVLLSNAFFLVIGFYFGRTNHARAGEGAGGIHNFK